MWKKECSEYSVLQGNTWEVLGVCENFLFVEVSNEYVMVGGLKEIYKANTTASTIFFVEGTQAPTFDTTYQERSP